MSQAHATLTAAILSLGWATASHAAERDVPVDLSTNLLAPLAGAVAVGIDVAAADRVSVEALVGSGRASIPLGGGQTWDYVWHPANVIGKFYVRPRVGADRFFVHAFARYETRIYHLTGSTLDFDPDHRATRYGLGAGAGYKHVFGSGVVLELAVGYGYQLGIFQEFYTDGREDEIPAAEWAPGLQLAKAGIGYRF